MIFKKIEIENLGPIENLNLEFPKNGTRPKPLIIVGENGSGKSILLSHLVNSLIVGKQTIYEDTEVEKGKVFKYRSINYVRSGKDYSFSNVEFESGEKVQEWELRRLRSDFEDTLGYTPLRREWNDIPANEHSRFIATFNSNLESTKKIFKSRCCLYFPVNRFEEPGWLNLINLKTQATYTQLTKVSGFSNRSIICTSPLRNNINWLLDLIFDRQAYDLKVSEFPVQFNENEPLTLGSVFEGYLGKSANIYDAVVSVIRIVLKSGENIRLGVDTRKNRQISVVKDEKTWIPNLFQLSTGEIQLINLFLSIIRDYDLSDGELESLDEINGIVVIDEIDSHLHTVLQKEVLPLLIKSFPNIQFVITTHSPIFLLGMEKEFGEDGFEIVNMPNGERSSAKDFSEFQAAYEAFKETSMHREEITREIIRNAKPILFVEGDYDVRYIQKAAELLDQTDVLEKVQLKNGDGFGNLDKIWRSYNNSLSEAIPNKIILLYDCDTNKLDDQKNLVFKRVLPSVSAHPIQNGIENLFSKETIDKVENLKPDFIDVQDEYKKRVRGVEINAPATKFINKDEKGNMCNWICEHGTIDDFTGFKAVFTIIKSIID